MTKHEIITATVGALAATVLTGSVATAQVASSATVKAVDVAALTGGEFGARIFVRGLEDGLVEHNIYTPAAGYSGWHEVPDPGSICIDFDELKAVQVLTFDQPPGARLYMRADESGYINQNIYTPATGYSGWYPLPHDDKADPVLLGEELSSADCVALNGLYGPRLFVRAWEEPAGLVEQCIYTPGDGYLGWTALPALDYPFGGGPAAGDGDVEAVAVTAYGALYDTRIFVVGTEEDRRVYQNVYTAADGYLGWTRVRNFSASTGSPSSLVAVDVLRLDDPAGALIYLQGRENGNVRQNVYTPQTGFSGWNRVPDSTATAGEGDLEDCAVTAFDGLFGPRIFVRCFEEGLVEQNIYTPGKGYSGWTEIPDP